MGQLDSQLRVLVLSHTPTEEPWKLTRRRGAQNSSQLNRCTQYTARCSFTHVLSTDVHVFHRLLPLWITGRALSSWSWRTSMQYTHLSNWFARCKRTTLLSLALLFGGCKSQMTAIRRLAHMPHACAPPRIHPQHMLSHAPACRVSSWLRSS